MEKHFSCFLFGGDIATGDGIPRCGCGTRRGLLTCSKRLLKAVPHRHFTFSILKVLRRYFLYDRELLHELSRCAWDSLKVFLTAIVPEEDAVPSAVIAVQTCGDFLGIDPHCHVLCTDEGFYAGGLFRVAPWFIPKRLEELFRYKVFKMLLSREKVTRDLIETMMGWRHSGFNVHCGPRIQPGDEEAMENLSPYIVRASFSQERMTYIPDESKVLYRSKDGKDEKSFDALEWLAAMCSHVPNIYRAGEEFPRRSRVGLECFKKTTPQKC